MLKRCVILLISFYRNYLSHMKGQCCRFYPSCSDYTLDAVRKYGVMRGVSKGAMRLSRCHPFSRGGYDPA